MFLAWLALAKECKDPGVCGKAAGSDVTQKDCYIKALKYGKDHPRVAPVWQWCGENNGPNKCTEKSVFDCFQQAVTLDRKLDAAWKLLGMELAKQPAGSDKFISPWKGHEFDKNQCLEQAVLLKPNSASNWFQYCKYGAGMLVVDEFSEIRCLARTLELDGPDAFTSNDYLAEVWYELSTKLNEGDTKTLDLMGKPWNSKECLDKAIELNPTKFAPPPANFVWYENGMKVKVPSVADWKTDGPLDLSKVHSALKSFTRGFADAKWGYLCPFYGVVPRFPLSSFAVADVQVLDLTKKDTRLTIFRGGFHDKTFGYLAPLNSLVPRFRLDTFSIDTVQILDLAALPDGTFLKGFAGGYATERHGYLIPGVVLGSYINGRVVRFPLLTFNTVEVLNFAQTEASLLGFSGGFIHGMHGYAIPYGMVFSYGSVAYRFGEVTRFGLQAFSDANVEFLDLTAIDLSLKGFAGGFKDLSYGYAVPHNTGVNAFGKVARWSLQSFMLADVQVLDLAAAAGGSGCLGFRHGFTDGTDGTDVTHGTYGYVLPNEKALGVQHGTVCRFSLETFDSSSVQKFDLTSIDPSFKGFMGGFAAGGHGYLVPSFAGTYSFSGKVVRFTLVSPAVVAGAGAPYDKDTAKDCFIQQVKATKDHAPSWYEL